MPRIGVRDNDAHTVMKERDTAVATATREPVTTFLSGTESRMQLLAKSVDELDLSVRVHNRLKASNIKTIGDLVRRKETEMLKLRFFGRKSLLDLIQVLDRLGLHFGMDVDRYLEG